MGLRVRIQFHGGPYNGRTASTKLLLDTITVCDGYDLAVHCYSRLDELQYGYAKIDSETFPRTNDGRDQFLRRALNLPDYGLTWIDDKNL